jgi:hypothetical protein
MANPTSNFNWQMPTPTDLVTDLPADFEVFGQAVDTSMADLLGGTTGQILAKNSNTNMDFVWITNDVGDITAVTAGTGISGGGTSGAVTITNSMATIIDAKGDLVPGTGADTFARLAVGSDYAFLQAEAAQSTGMKWNNAAWTQFVPVVTSAGGAITSYVADGYYTRIGKLCVWRFYVNLTGVGTATGAMFCTMPFQAAGGAMGVGRESAVNGAMLSCTTGFISTTRLDINVYNNTTPFVAGSTNVCTISYEVA